ncbi:hypothetical protein C9374_000879 [Naegleria lovaniensis]|uniref:Uncharacterized protein n=1 Tax=Naegleria lovaniensis TaxID=51637 RepID=A0AA88KNH3_NAELO|nr:uncharacterized protein C9374_000879 [Naegleria lovaniensis]KAG2388029.1 hypothetical protein C9374_000879 [Naegleria lovaniensis]
MTLVVGHYCATPCHAHTMRNTQELDTFSESFDFSNTVNISDVSQNGLLNYPLQFGRPFLKGEIPTGYVPGVKLNGVLIDSQADITTRYEDGSVRFAVLSVVLPKIEKGGNATMWMVPILKSASSTPCTISEILTALPDADISISLSGNGTATFTTVSARNFISQNLYYWNTNRGSIRCELVVVDHLTRRADFGLNGGPKSFRPIFYFHFWRTIHRLRVRAVLENSNLDTLQDVLYNVTISKGYSTSATMVYSQNNVQHLFGARWTKIFWFGGQEPESRVNFDYNINYLSATYFIPNYPKNNTQTEKQIASYYSNWLTTPRGLMEAGVWTPYMPQTGMRDDIGIMPEFVHAWLTLGDWRYREISLISADLAGGWKSHFREIDSQLKFDRNQTVSAIGKPISLNAHPTLWFPDNSGKYMGALNVPQLPNSKNWVFDGAHQPDPFSIPYILTGDSYYLESLQLWAASGIMRISNGQYGRGMTGYGGITEQVRGQAWTFRTRCYAALLSPDDSHEKLYFTQTVEDAIAYWEGQRGVNDTLFLNHPNRQWAAKNSAFVWSPLRFWSRDTNTKQASLWQEYFMIIVFGMMRDLGFSTHGILKEYHQIVTTHVGAPNYDPRYMGYYWAYVMDSNLNWFKTWAEFKTQNDLVQNDSSIAAVNQFQTGAFPAIAATCASSFTAMYSNGPETWEFTRSLTFDKFDLSVNYRSFKVYPRSFAPPHPPQPSSLPRPSSKSSNGTAVASDALTTSRVSMGQWKSVIGIILIMAFIVG